MILTLVHGFIFLDLLEFDPNLFCELLLRHARQPPAVTDALPYVNIDCVLWHFRPHVLRTRGVKDGRWRLLVMPVS